MDRVSVCRRASNLAASALCHNATLFDLYFAHSTSSLFKPTTTAAVGGIASWVASTTALPFPCSHTRIELGQQRCADRKKSNRDRIIDRKIESKSIKPNRNITRGKTGDYQNCSVLYSVLKLCTVITTFRRTVLSSLDWVLSHWAHFTCVGSFVFVFYVFFMLRTCLIIVTR